MEFGGRGGAWGWFAVASLLPGAAEGFLMDADRNMSCHGRVVELVFGSGSLEYGTNSISRTVLYTERSSLCRRERKIKESSFRKRKREKEKDNDQSGTDTEATDR